MADLAMRIEAVARHLLGPPNKKLSNRRTLRFGSHGKICVTINGAKRSSGSGMSASLPPMTGQAESSRTPHSRRTSRNSTRR